MHRGSGCRNTVRDEPAQQASPQERAPYRPKEVRGGEIILNTSLERAIFIAGLVGAVVLVLILAVFR
jgi:hypothetical protein